MVRSPTHGEDAQRKRNTEAIYLQRFFCAQYDHASKHPYTMAVDGAAKNVHGNKHEGEGCEPSDMVQINA
jgi:hypothetical protein